MRAKRLQLGGPRQGAKRAGAKGGVVQSVVYAGDQHEHRQDELDGRALKGGDRSVARRKAPGRHGGECMAQSVEARHAEAVEGEERSRGEHQIEAPQNPRCLRDTRAQPLGRSPRHLLPEHLLSSGANVREHRHEQNNDAHTSEPLNDRAPQEQRPGEGALDVGHHRCPGGGEAAHRLKEGVVKGHTHPEDKGNGTENTRGHPDEPHPEDRLPPGDLLAHVKPPVGQGGQPNRSGQPRREEEIGFATTKVRLRFAKHIEGPPHHPHIERW